MAAHQKNRSDGAEAQLVALDLLSSVDNNAMTDTVLVAADGERIPASRFVLGARSPVLQKMLFRDKSTSLKYSGLVVRAVVEYCCTNDIAGFAKGLDDVREVVHLMDCAGFLELKGLQKRTSILVDALLKKDPCKACEIYDEASSSDRLKNLALKTMKEFPEKALLRSWEFGAPGVLSLSPTCLEMILGDQEMDCEEIILFKALVAWANNTPPSSKGGRFSKKEKRTKIAKALVTKCLELSHIAPSDLVTTVAESGLVEPSAVWNALKDAALRAEQDHKEIKFSIRRKAKKEEFPLLLVTDGIFDEASADGKLARTPTRSMYRTTTQGSNKKSLDDTDDTSLVMSESSGSTPTVSPSRVQSRIKTRHRGRHLSTGAVEEGEGAGIRQEKKSKHKKKTVRMGASTDAAAAPYDDKEEEHSGRVKGRLVSLAEKFDTACVCGSSNGPYQ